MIPGGGSATGSQQPGMASWAQSWGISGIADPTLLMESTPFWELHGPWKEEGVH